MGTAQSLVLVATGRGVKLAWRVTADVDSDEVYTSLVDAASGEVLASVNKVEDVDATGEAWEYYPGAASGGTAALANWTAAGWLPADSTVLSGPFARVFADLDDDDAVDAGEEATEVDSVWDYNLDVEQHAQGFCAPQPGLHERLHLGQHLPGELVDEPEAELRAGVPLREHVPRPPEARRPRHRLDDPHVRELRQGDRPLRRRGGHRRRG